ncbi:MAG: transporter [Gemmatimonadales bacterium]|nr:transporter [Gemmatimonadales bacterium]
MTSLAPLVAIHLALFTVYSAFALAQSPAPAPIADNSFLLEEAYNQEAGVVQHITTFARPEGGDAWDFSFTQEWPLGGIRHQLSYTVPLGHADGLGTALGDIGLNYRYQLAGEAGGPLAVAPRLTALLPTGSEDDGRGSGALGLQTNLPVSYTFGSAVATHWNAGFTVASGSAPAYTLGASAVWLLRPAFNLLVEAVWSTTGGEESSFLNPGVRWAHDFSSGLQIVPGLAYTVGLGSSSGEDGLFLYLSFEHPFRRLSPQ